MGVTVPNGKAELRMKSGRDAWGQASKQTRGLTIGRGSDHRGEEF